MCVCTYIVFTDVWINVQFVDANGALEWIVEGALFNPRRCPCGHSLLARATCAGRSHNQRKFLRYQHTRFHDCFVFLLILISRSFCQSFRSICSSIRPELVCLSQLERFLETDLNLLFTICTDISLSFWKHSQTQAQTVFRFLIFARKSHLQINSFNFFPFSSNLFISIFYELRITDLRKR